eukprot:COSAG02_NODE_5733_length_4083_cov_1.905371_2_plen_82_part_00
MSGKVSLGDIIVSVEDRTIRTMEDLFRALSKKRPGQTVKLQLLRSFGGTFSQSNRILGIFETMFLIKAISLGCGRGRGGRA